jgi:hypothetical protein
MNEEANAEDMINIQVIFPSSSPNKPEITDRLLNLLIRYTDNEHEVCKIDTLQLSHSIQHNKPPYILIDMICINERHQLEQSNVNILYDLVKSGYQLFEVYQHHLRRLDDIDVQIDYWVHTYIINRGMGKNDVKSRILAVHSKWSIPFDRTKTGYRLPI